MGVGMWMIKGERPISDVGSLLPRLTRVSRAVTRR
jgi:hypothetical protein